MSEGKEEVVIELEEERKTREDKYKEWEKGLKSYVRAKVRKGNVHVSLKSFPDVALRLQYLQDVENKLKSSVVGGVLRKHFAEILKLPAPEETEIETVGDRLIKVIKNTEKLLNIYEKHTGFSYSFSRVLGHNWQEEKSNWKTYHDRFTSTIELFEKGVSIAILDLKEISSLHLFETNCRLLDRIKNIENEVSSKEDLEKLKNLASDITGAIGFATKIEKLIKKYREIIEMEK